MDEEGIPLEKSTGETIRQPRENPSFLSALKASHETVKLYVGLIGLIGGVPAAVLVLNGQYIHNLWYFRCTLRCTGPADPDMARSQMA